MLSWIRNQAQDHRTALDLYGATVAQARNPEIFGRSGIEDTAEGRTSMLILHMFLVLDRLSQMRVPATRVARLLSETFVTDIDDCLREMGVGDLSVPKKVKRAAQALGERCAAYRSAVEKGPGSSALASELSATLPGLGTVTGAAEQLAAYVVGARGFLSSLADEDVLAGRIAFPAF